MGSNPTEGMDIFLRLICVYVSCVGGGLTTGWSPTQAVLLTILGWRNRSYKKSFSRMPCPPKWDHQERRRENPNALCNSWGIRNVSKAETKHSKRHAAGAISLELSVNRLLLGVVTWSICCKVFWIKLNDTRNYRSLRLVFFLCFLKDLAQQSMSFNSSLCSLQRYLWKTKCRLQNLRWPWCPHNVSAHGTFGSLIWVHFDTVQVLSGMFLDNIK
jgi:hypothetical protein